MWGVALRGVGPGPSVPFMGTGTVRFHLDDGLRDSVGQGAHNFLNLVAQVCDAAGLRVELVRDTPANRRDCAGWGGYDLFHMEEPPHDRAVTVRRVYHYPFWAIERTNRRWDWTVAQAGFPGGEGEEAARFAAFWRKRLFGPVRPVRGGHVYVPLQGRIRAHRSFQTCAPVQMLREVLTHDPDRNVVATLHPGEVYDAADHAALRELEAEFSRFRVETGDMARHLETCDYVVTQNSSAAFNGFFFGKPCVLFGRVDFHHIAADVATLGAAQAIRQAPDMTPDYDGYLHWFWQRMSINAGRPDADERIAAALRRCGWPV